MFLCVCVLVHVCVCIVMSLCEQRERIQQQVELLERRLCVSNGELQQVSSDDTGYLFTFHAFDWLCVFLPIGDELNYKQEVCVSDFMVDDTYKHTTSWWCWRLVSRLDDESSVDTDQEAEQVRRPGVHAHIHAYMHPNFCTWWNSSSSSSMIFMLVTPFLKTHQILHKIRHGHPRLDYPIQRGLDCVLPHVAAQSLFKSTFLIMC